MLNDARQYSNGDSQFHNDEPTLEFAVEIEGMPLVAFNRIANASGRLAAFHCPSILAKSRDEAIAIAMQVYTKMAAQITVIRHVPLTFSGALAITKDRTRWIALCRIGFPDRDLDIKTVPLHNPAAQMFSYFYAEGLLSPSPFYALLSFNKVTEFITKNRQKFRAELQAKGLPTQDTKRTIPADPFQQLLPEFVGLSFAAAADRLRGSYQNYVKHIIADDDYFPNTFDGDEHMKCSAAVARFVAHGMLQDFEADVATLMANGFTRQNFADMVGAKYTSEPAPDGAISLG